MRCILKNLHNGHSLYLENNQRLALPYADLGVIHPDHTERLSCLPHPTLIYREDEQSLPTLPATVHRLSGPTLEMEGQGGAKRETDN